MTRAEARVIAREAHDSWCAWMRARGFAHGSAYDADAKTHHWLVPFDDLPELRRAHMIRGALDEGRAGFIDVRAELGPRPA